MQCREQLTKEDKALTQKHLDTLGSSITTTREEQTTQREHLENTTQDPYSTKYIKS